MLIIDDRASASSKPEIATFASGCFWGTEHIFLKHFPPSEKKGILSTSVGYTGGNPLVTNPTYRLVCGGATDHAESVKIEFDPSVVTYEQLVGEYLDCSVPSNQTYNICRVFLSHTRPNDRQPSRRRHGHT